MKKFLFIVMLLMSGVMYANDSTGISLKVVTPIVNTDGYLIVDLNEDKVEEIKNEVETVRNDILSYVDDTTLEKFNENTQQITETITETTIEFTGKCLDIFMKGCNDLVDSLLQK